MNSTCEVYTFPPGTIWVSLVDSRTYGLKDRYLNVPVQEQMLHPRYLPIKVSDGRDRGTFVSRIFLYSATPVMVVEVWGDRFRQHLQDC
ncbi:MAG: hypothetical protein PHF57_04950 [Methanoregula sp.]|nr:hypothetical protein [Methanoregula sp.]